MKKVILLAIVLISTIACVSTQVVSAPAPMSSNVVSEDNKKTNYIKANEWMIENFGNAESVIQFSDKEAGIIKGKYLMDEGVYFAASKYSPEVKTDKVFAVITIRVRDEKSRIEIALTSDEIGVVSYGGKTYGTTTEQLQIKGNELMSSFASHMKGKSANETW